MKPSSIILLLCVGLMLEGCSTPSEQAWVQAPPPGWKGIALPDKHLSEVRHSKVGEARQMLRGAFFQVLNSSQLLEFTEDFELLVSGDQDRVFVLVQSAFREGLAQPYEMAVSDDGRDVCVYSLFKDSRTELERSAVVLSLKKAPKNVYVSFKQVE